MLDYETLRVLWWLLLGLVLIGFAVMDGFDLGVAILLPWVARDDTERRIVINSIGPVWDGNQVWLILGGGAAFAAWPPLYATAFSGFYVALFLVLAALILRPVGFDFRNKVDDVRWRRVWDTALFTAGFVPTLVFGVAFGNLLQGVPFHFDDELRVTYTGDFLLHLLNPFALLTGLLSLAMLIMHGAVYLIIKTEGAIEARARRALAFGAPLTAVLFSVCGLWIAFGIDGYVVVEGAARDAASNPLAKAVVREPGAWLANYRGQPWMLIAPALGYVGAAGAYLLVRAGRPGLAFVGSAASVFGIVSTAGLSMFPFLMPSSTDPRSSLTVWDSSSSQLTLFIMLIASVVVLPIVASYTVFVYRVLRGKITSHDIAERGPSLY
ncbi:MAG: cytochrome d ubiquinol oxidase subunit II [Rhodospirillales bacterium]|nr:cytochrome d ubiquinol oxidase subunit II [Rhodospirillales bacterium]